MTNEGAFTLVERHDNNLQEISARHHRSQNIPPTSAYPAPPPLPPPRHAINSRLHLRQQFYYTSFSWVSMGWALRDAPRYMHMVFWLVGRSLASGVCREAPKGACV